MTSHMPLLWDRGLEFKSQECNSILLLFPAASAKWIHQPDLHAGTQHLFWDQNDSACRDSVSKLHWL